MKKIALTQSFRELRESDCVYVDKTEQIFRLLMTRRTFISRPGGSANRSCLTRSLRSLRQELSPISGIPGFTIAGLSRNILY